MFIQQKKLPSAQQVKLLLPLDDNLKTKKAQFDEELRQNLKAKQKLVVVCGPCSADDPTAVKEYLARLKNASDRFSSLLLVARIYTTKPRSNGVGYKGLCFGTDGHDIAEGILQCRQMMIDCIRIGLPVADELLYPELHCYFDDLVSYNFLGARSSEDSLHRAYLSGIDLCCGVKNATDGDVDKLVQSLQAVSLPSVFPFDGQQISTTGCQFCHAVLRGGAVDGEFFANFSSDTTAKLKAQLQVAGLNDFIMADLSHANSKKIPQNQIENGRIAVADKNVNGVMIESYLFEGAGCGYGVSKTDACLGFDDTQMLLQMLNTEFAKR